MYLLPITIIFLARAAWPFNDDTAHLYFPDMFVVGFSIFKALYIVWEWFDDW